MFSRLFHPWLWLLTAGILWGGNLYAEEWSEELILREKIDLQLQLRAKRFTESLGDSLQAHQAVAEGFRSLYSEPARLENEKEVDWAYLKEAIQTLADGQEDDGVRSALAFLEKNGHTISVQEQYFHTALKKFSRTSPQWQVLKRWGKVSRFLETVVKLEKTCPILPDCPKNEGSSQTMQMTMLASPVSRVLENTFSWAEENLVENLSVKERFCFSFFHGDNHFVQQKQTVVLLI